MTKQTVSKKEVEDNRERIPIQFGDKTVVLILEPFDADVDLDEYTSIHKHNIVGELLTATTALNRIGIFQAQINAELSKLKLDFEIFNAEMYEKKKKDLTFPVSDGKGGEKASKPTVDEIDAAVKRSPEYKVKKTKLIEFEKHYEMIASFYWAMKDKCENIKIISNRLVPEEFERNLVEEKVNGIYLKIHKNE